jgi:hypothetical protein
VLEAPENGDAAQPVRSWPPPKSSPRTVTYHRVAAVVTPVTSWLSRLTMTPAPMKPMPERMPSGRRMRSFMTKELPGLPIMGRSRLTCNIAKVAARQTSMVVRRPAGWPRSSRLRPMRALAMTASVRRRAICAAVRLRCMGAP